jgi:nucleotide-binding universal stress UspA family protein
MKILIAVDDSPHSERAIRFATLMRWPAGSRVIVANVMPLPATAGDPATDLAAPRQHQEAVMVRAQDHLREAGLSTEARAIEGDAREQLVLLAAQDRVDLVVLGSRGHSGLSRWMLGSVSSHAVTHMACSVLVVKGGRRD